VVEELSAPEAPHTVLTWMKNRPAWLEVRAITGTDASLNHLGKGEREGIALAEALHADLVLMDDLEARREAVNRKLPVRGTLGVLTEAARQNLLSLKDAFIRLQATSFYAAPALLTWLLEEEERRRKNR
jgi:predicted nucleic acid-binding protein